MLNKVISWAMLAMLLAAGLVLVLKTPVVKATDTIYIRADGSIDPPTAPMQQNANNHTLASDGFTLQGSEGKEK